MNKATHLQANSASRASRDNKVNQNLSPSLARIRNRAAPTPTNNAPNVEKTAPSAPANQPSPARPAPVKPQHPISDPARAPQILSSGANDNRQTGSSSARIAPWLFASITLTLALFSGNYAWQTQQGVEKMNARLVQLEAAPLTNTPDLPETGDRLANAERELRSLKQTQQQLTGTITALQAQLNSTSGLTDSRLKSIEGEQVALSTQVQSALTQKIIATPAEKKPLLGASAASKTTAEADATRGNPEANAAREYWFINIASFSDSRSANASYERVAKIADKASIKSLTINGKTLYRIRAEGYSSQQAAEEAAQVLQTRLGVSGLWVSRG
ncbi:hypothetical protein A9Q89_08720 [Gammaproteobacteria bacterium 53_120_T64]|nr:hypothetical protein A9Q89_08720 [Gammaproteobacteria bacterium 53_120_T64]